MTSGCAQTALNAKDISFNKSCSTPLSWLVKSGSIDPSLPANPDGLLKRPGWKETTHPKAGENGRRTFENKEKGDLLEFDKGKPGETGHERHDHYHRPNPNVSGRHDEYLDGEDNPVRKHSDPCV